MKFSTALLGLLGAGVQVSLAAPIEERDLSSWHGVSKIERWNHGSYAPLADLSSGKAVRGQRMPSGRFLGTRGIKDLNSRDLACGPGGNREAPEWVEITNAYNGIRVKWDSIYDEKAKKLTPFGNTYVGPYAAFISTAGDVNRKESWLKLTEWNFERAGYWREDLEKKVWGSDVVKNYQGDLFIPIFSGLQAGKYIIRLELINLANAAQSYKENPRKGAEIYPICIQVKIKNILQPYEEPPIDLYDEYNLPQWAFERASFPGTYTYDSPGLKWDLKKQNPEDYRHPVGKEPLLRAGRAFYPDSIPEVDHSFLHHRI